MLKYRGDIMERKGISQETLKAIACVTMLIDHIGSMFVNGYALRIIGRIAFPIFCFLMAEGAYYTKNPQKYALRLVIGMLLSEIPFDLAFQHKITWARQSVMVTLLFGFLAVEALRYLKNDFLKLGTVAALAGLAEYIHTDYGGAGVLLVILFSQSRGNLCLQSIILFVICVMMNSLKIPFLGMRIPIELFAVLAMIPIAFYSGKKATSSKTLQWAFYLFYPVHLSVLCLVRYFLTK